MRSFKIWLRMLMAGMLLVMGGATAQTTDGTTEPGPANLIVHSLIPDLVAIRTSSDPIAFQIDATNFPPLTFPASYVSVARDITVYSSTPNPWSLQLQLLDIVNEEGGVVVPVTQLAFRVNEGPWIKSNGAPQVILSQVGPTAGWTVLKLEVMLELRGGEVGGSYQADLTLSALVLP